MRSVLMELNDMRTLNNLLINRFELFKRNGMYSTNIKLYIDKKIPSKGCKTL